MNGIRGKTPLGRQSNPFLDAVVRIIKYNKRTNDHAIYIKIFSDITISYLMVYTDDVLNINNNKTSFTELRNVFEESL